MRTFAHDGQRNGEADARVSSMTSTQPPRGQVTLQEIADLVGAHVSSVSRALAHHRSGGAPRSELAARIVTLADRLGYERDIAAVGLRTRRSRMIGVLVPRLTDLAMSAMYEGLEDAASERGYQSAVANTHDDPSQQRTRIARFLSRRVDGLVLADSRFDHAQGETITKAGVPVVLTNRWQDGVDSVTCDDTVGGGLAGEHLSALGHRRIAVLAGEPYATTGRDRSQGFLAALRLAGISVPSDWVIPTAFSADGGYRATAELFARDGEPPTAIFAVTDMIAIGALAALRDLGLTVGADVSVVGFNDISIAKDLLVPLTTVRAPLEEMGSRAVELLISRIESELVDDPVSIRLTPELVVRASASAPRHV